jgi:hypothetical protein
MDERVRTDVEFVVETDATAVPVLVGAATSACASPARSVAPPAEPVCLNTRRKHEQLIKRSLMLNYVFIGVLLYPTVHTVLFGYLSDPAVLLGIFGAGLWFTLTLIPLIILVIRAVRIRKCLTRLRLSRNFVDNVPVEFHDERHSYVIVDGVQYSGNRENGVGVTRRLPWAGPADAPVVYFRDATNQPALIIQGSRFALIVTELSEYLPNTGSTKISAMHNPTRHFGMFMGVCILGFALIHICLTAGYVGLIQTFCYDAIYLLIGTALFGVCFKYCGLKGAIAKSEISKEIARIEKRIQSAPEIDHARERSALFWLNSALGSKGKLND